METHQKIKNKHYREFLDHGIIKTLDIEQIQTVLNNVKHRHGRQARALIIASYYTGARPNELLRLTVKDCKTDQRFLILSLKGSKGGLPRDIPLDLRVPLVQELATYCKSIPIPDAFIFYAFRSGYKRTIVKKNGTVIIRSEVSTTKTRYHFLKWFGCVLSGGVPPYYLRHNRFSKLSMAGATLEQIRQMKGSKSTESVMPYLHMSMDLSKKTSRLNR